MERKLKTLQFKINAKFWLSAGGDVIYSNMCTMYPDNMMLVANLGLVADTYYSSSCESPCFRFFNVNS